VLYAFLFPLTAITAFSRTVSLEKEEGFFEIYFSLPHNRLLSLLLRMILNMAMMILFIIVLSLLIYLMLPGADFLFMLRTIIKPSVVLGALSLFFTALTGNRFAGMLPAFMLWAEELVFKSYITKGLSLYADFMVKYRSDIFPYSIELNNIVLYMSSLVLIGVSLLIYKSRYFTGISCKR
jgi:hypothetical protein